MMRHRGRQSVRQQSGGERIQSSQLPNLGGFHEPLHAADHLGGADLRRLIDLEYSVYREWPVTERPDRTASLESISARSGGLADMLEQASAWREKQWSKE